MTVGIPPLAGMEQGLVDATWLLGIAGGQNQTSAILTANVAASQTTGTQIPSGQSLIEVDTSVATGSLVLPAAVAGTELTIINNTANALNLYANPNVNQLTGALDTISTNTNPTAVTLAANQTVTWVSCAKNGKWFTK